MAKAFNSSGVEAGSCVLLIGVDSDNETVKDFSPTGAALTQDAGGSAPANGTYGYGFQITEKDSDNDYGYSVSGGPSVNGAAATSIFIAYNEIAAADAEGTYFFPNSSISAQLNAVQILFQEIVGGGLQPELAVEGNALLPSGVDLTTGTPHSIACVSEYGGPWGIYIDGSVAASGSNPGYGGASTTIGRIGNLAGQGSMAANICYLAYFDTSLSATDVANLHASLSGGGAFSLISLPAGAGLAGAANDAGSASGKLNSDFLAAASDSTTAAGNLYPFASAQPFDISSATGALSTAIRLAGAASSSTSLAASLTNFQTVTLGAPLYTGVGSILDANGTWSDGAPGAGTPVLYDSTFMTVEPNGEIVATSNNFTAACQWNNGGTWSTLTVVVMPGPVAYAQSASSVLDSLSTAIQLLGAANDITSTTANLITQAKLQGLASAVGVAAGSLQTAIKAASAAVDASAASGTLQGTQQHIASSADDNTSASAVLNTQIVMLGAAVALTNAIGSLTTQIILAGNALSVTSASGSLRTGTSAGAAATDTSSATGALLAGINFSGPASDFTGAAAQLLTGIALLSSTSDASSAAASLRTGALLSSAASAIATATGALSTAIRLAGAAQGSSAASASLSTQAHFAGAAQDTSTAAADLGTRGSIAAQPASDDSTATGAVSTGIQVAAAPADSSIGAAELFTSIDPDANAADESQASGALAPAGSQLFSADALFVAPAESDWPASGLLPWGARYQRLGTRLVYAITWSQWLAQHWQAGLDVALGDRVRPTKHALFQARCTEAGTSADREPLWPGFLGAEVLDGSAVWVLESLDDGSLAARIAPPVLWSASSDLILFANQRLIGQTALVTIDTSEALAGVDYDVSSMINATDGRQKAAKIRIKVR
ncbi:MAG: hypothetical protein ACREUT_21170 [Steroidobacteraceae bacterium]